MNTRLTERIWSPERLLKRFFPRTTLGQGLIAAAPWLNVLLLILMFLSLERKIILQPGTTVELPAGPFADGSSPSHIAVLLWAPGTGEKPPREMVFFEDERFFVDDEAQMNELRRAFEKQLGQRPDVPLVIQADRRVSHGTVVALVNLARQVGVKMVNVASRPE